MARTSPGNLLIAAGGLTWVVVGMPKIAALAAGRAPMDARAEIGLLAYAAFGAAFAVAATSDRLGSRGRVAALVVQSVSALGVMATGRSGFEGALLCVVAGEAPLMVGGAAAFAWVIAQTAAMLAIRLALGEPASFAALSTAVFAGFQLFAFGAARLAASESAARQEVGRVHAELLATQELFADSARTAERLRIARELHDALGHHLTALSLQLELARNVVEGRAKEPVDQAHALTKELLGELRTVVGTMREDQPIDLARALRTLVAGIPRPRVHLDIPASLRVEPALAHAIFRCVQEALTNAVRHADAANVFLAVEERDGTIGVSARDDGRGASTGNVKAGHGLSGLRERVEAMGGRVEIDSRPGEGVTLRALLPSRGGAS
jgi:signal transduction histidine kinase